MSRRFRFVSITLSLLCAMSAHSQQPVRQLPEIVSDQVIVAFEPGVSGLEVASAHSQAGTTPLRRVDAIGAVVAQVLSGDVPAAVAAYSRNPNVRYAEPNYLRPLVIPDEGTDPQLGIDYFDEQYNLHNAGQSFYYDPYTGQLGAVSGVEDADIDAPEAWDLHTGSPLVTVAVLDSGVDCNHADLLGKCIENTNFGPSATLADEIGHGTHVAGIIGAAGDNGIGVAGVSWNTSLASLKVCYEYYDPIFGLVGLCDAAASAAAMVHAADQGYQVINMSYAGPSGSQAEADAAAYAWSRGTVLVAAAANAYDQTPMYPAAFPEVIAVAATDWYDNLASFSSFGNWVSLAAPGQHILGTLPHAQCGIAQNDPEGCYGWLSGTSMASPTVAGAAALVWAYLGTSAGNAAVRSALESNADATGTLQQNMLAWTQHGRLNLHGALSAAGAGEPPPTGPGVHVGDLDGASLNQGSAWVAQVTVYVHDETHLSAAGTLTVQGIWSGGFAGSASCVTEAGQCTVSSDAIPKRNASATFRVTGIGGGDAYLSSANHDPESDSDGHSIAVAK